MTTIPDAAIEAAAEAIDEVAWNTYTAADFDPAGVARAAIEAAMPAIREHIAQEIEAQRERISASRNPQRQYGGWSAVGDVIDLVRGGDA